MPNNEGKGTSEANEFWVDSKQQLAEIAKRVSEFALEFDKPDSNGQHISHSSMVRLAIMVGALMARENPMYAHGVAASIEETSRLYPEHSDGSKKILEYVRVLLHGK